MNDSFEDARSAAEAEVPIIWLLGKAQAGKTSIVAELTGQAHDDIGKGYRPMTREARVYSVPVDHPALRFLDTRGLGDVDGNDPRGDLAVAERQAHVVIAVMRVDDLEQAEVVAALHRVRRARPRIPVIVAQSCLHRPYGRHDRHPDPYPFDGSDQDASRPGVPDELARVMMAQRRLFRDLSGDRPPVIVPLDFTRPEQGIAPADYGAERLWAALEAQVPRLVEDLRGLTVPNPDAAIRAKVILPWAVAAAAANALPLPVVGGLGSASLQAAMVGQIARRLGVLAGVAVWREFVAALGTGFALGFGGRWLVQQAVKLGPGWGQALVATWTLAITWGIGEAALYFFREKAAGREPDREALLTALQGGMARAREHHAARKGDSS
jgi:uncharacterized protein (DUF697 family)